MGELFTDQRLQVAGRLGGNAGSVHLRQLFQNGNMSLSSVDKIFRNLTTAMTAVVRTSGAEGSAWEARGEMWYSTTCMKIEWHWIAFPAIMIGLTIIFLALVAIESRGVQKDRLWKSSVLATLFCEVDIAKTSEDQIVDKHAMVKTASSTSVSIDKSGGRLRLVGT